jgi:transposase
MTNQLFEAASGIKAPWYVQGVDFDTAKRQLTIAVDFVAGSRFACPGVAGFGTERENLALDAKGNDKWQTP